MTDADILTAARALVAAFDERDAAERSHHHDQYGNDAFERQCRARHDVDDAERALRRAVDQARPAPCACPDELERYSSTERDESRAIYLRVLAKRLRVARGSSHA